MRPGPKVVLWVVLVDRVTLNPGTCCWRALARQQPIQKLVTRGGLREFSTFMQTVECV